jgi:CHAD domain-containing protein
MAGSKWINALTATTPLPEAARRVLTVRLEVVRDGLPLALYESEKDPEHVHQLRVGTRRAGAALDTFASCLPDKVYKSAKKRLRGLRRSAGEARDWDVFLADLVDWKQHQKPRHHPGLTFLIGYAFCQRRLAQGRLVENGAEYPFSFDRFLAQTVAAVARPQGVGPRLLLDLARPRLSAMLQELNQAAAGDLDDYEQLHQVRILGKRLRYALEIFADCLEPESRAPFYAAIEEMQEVLGNANDSYVACQRLDALQGQFAAMLPGEWPRIKIGLEALLSYHQARLLRERKRFDEFWARWRRSVDSNPFTSLLKTVGGSAA